MTNAVFKHFKLEKVISFQRNHQPQWFGDTDFSYDVLNCRRKHEVLPNPQNKFHSEILTQITRLGEPDVLEAGTEIILSEEVLVSCSRRSKIDRKYRRDKDDITVTSKQAWKTFNLVQSLPLKNDILQRDQNIQAWS